MESCNYELITNNKEVMVHPHKMNKATKDTDEEIALQISESKCAAALTNSGQRRLVSLDVFRGLTVAVMILVDHTGRIIPAINHSPWNGVTLADFVMPFFLFIVGVSLAFAYKKLSCRVVATRKAFLRALKLLILGIFLQGGFFHGINDLTFGVDIEQIRWMGTLQRIAIAYLLTALCEIWLKGDDTVNSSLSLLRKYLYQGVVALLLTGFYLGLLYGLYVPDWECKIPTEPPKIYSIKCGVRADTGPACNVVGMIDRMILGTQHLYKRPIYARTHECSVNSPNYGPLPPNAPAWCHAPFEPEGLLSSTMGVVTCFVGLHYGHIILHFKDHGVRILHWIVLSICLVVFGLALDVFGVRINKVLYSLSYMCVTAGAAGSFFAGTYFLVDVCGCNRMTLVLEWMGIQALMIYIFAACDVGPIIIQGFYYKTPHNNIFNLLGIGT